MPVSKRSPRRRSADKRPAPAPPQRRPRKWRKRIGWPLVAIGGILFFAGNIGARTGIAVLPFDPHHVFAQFGGAAIAIVGLMLATGR